MIAHRLRVFIGLVLVMACVADCRGGRQTKEEYLASGDKFVSAQKYFEAIVQYRNAVSLDPKFGEARYRLAQTYVKTKNLGAASGEYIRAADLLPDNVDAQLQASKFLLLARRFDDAKARAEGVLAKNPKNVEAQVAKATALAGLKDMPSALAEMEEAIKMDPQNSRSYMVLGAMQVTQNRSAEAEAAFKRAVELDPKSVEAQQALANFYWAAGRLAEAEASLRKIVELDPKDLPSQRMLATFLMSTGRAKEAEAPLKAVADSTQTAEAMMALADYYLGQGRTSEARPLLEKVALKSDGFATAKIRLAQLDYGQKRGADAHREVDEVLAKDAKNVNALALKAQFLLTEGKLDDALTNARAAVSASAALAVTRESLAASAAAQGTLGDVLATRNDVQGAIDAFNSALKADPRLVSAKIKLTELELQKGNIEAALQNAQDAVRLAPTSLPARMLRARTLLAHGDVDLAEADLVAVTKQLPNLAMAHAQMGELQLVKRNQAAARREFDRALEIDPDSFEGLRGRVLLDLGDKRNDQARVAVEKQLEKFPKNRSLLMLAAAVYGGTGDSVKQEATLNRLVEVDPNNMQAYAALAAFYVRQGKLEEAQQRYQSIAQKGSETVAARTMIGLILEAQGKKLEAQGKKQEAQRKKQEAKLAYEKLIESDPESAVAANNLAWIYAEEGGNLDVALRLAQTAKRHMLTSPEVADTLGWVFYKKDLVEQAKEEFRVSRDANPKEPQYHLHLGLALAKSGDVLEADAEYDKALTLKPDYQEARDAKLKLHPAEPTK